MFRVTMIKRGRVSEYTNVINGTVEVDSWEMSKKLISEFSWSPILYSEQIRDSNFFDSVECIGLDVNDGLSLSDAIDLFKDFKCIIATTQNHQKDKLHIDGSVKSKAQDRYRILLFLDSIITTKGSYKATWDSLKALCPQIDLGTSDTAKFFQPAVSVVYDNEHGKLVSVVSGNNHTVTYNNRKIPQNFTNAISSFKTGETQDKITLKCIMPAHIDKKASGVIFKDSLAFWCSGCKEYRVYEDVCKLLQIKEEVDKEEVNRLVEDQMSKMVLMTDLLKREEVEPEWLVNELIPMNCVTILGGDSNVSKSWVCLDLFLATAHQEIDFLNKIDVPKTEMIYFAYEDSEEQIRRRLGKLIRGRCLDEQEIISTSSLSRIMSMPRDIDYSQEKWVKVVCEITKRLGAKGIIIDTFRKASGADENDSGQVDLIASALKTISVETGAAVIVTHHIRKPSYNNKQAVNKHDLRGSSALVGSADAILMLSCIDQPTPHTKHLKLDVVKQRDASVSRSELFSQTFCDADFESYVKWEDIFSCDTVDEEDLHINKVLNKLAKLVNFTARDINRAQSPKHKDGELTAWLKDNVLIEVVKMTKSKTELYKLVDDWSDKLDKLVSAESEVVVC